MKGRVVICKEYGKPFEIEGIRCPRARSGSGVAAHDASRYLRVGPAHLARRPSQRAPASQRARHGPRGHRSGAHAGRGVTTDSAGGPIEEGDRVVYAAVFPVTTATSA